MILILLTWTVVAADEIGHGHGRSSPHGDQAVKAAIDKLDKQFLYLLSTIAGGARILFIHNRSLTLSGRCWSDSLGNEEKK